MANPLSYRPIRLFRNPLPRARARRRQALFALTTLLLIALIAGGLITLRMRMRRHNPSPAEIAAAMEHDFPVVVSPNCDERPWGARIDCVVLHATAAPTQEASLRGLTDLHRRVSAHYLIDRNGTILQLVPLSLRAWHAGTSSFQGRGQVNDYSIGIEMVNMNRKRDRFTAAQYHAVARVIRLLRHTYGYDIPEERIVSHAAIALPRGRKTDPAAFDFARLHRLLH